MVSATGFPPSSDIYVVINQVIPKQKAVGKTKHHKSPNGTVKFDETFKFACTPDAQFQIQAKEQHTFSSDEDLGDALYVVDESGSAAEKEVKVGGGTVVIKSSFHPQREQGSDREPQGQRRPPELPEQEGQPRPAQSRGHPRSGLEDLERPGRQKVPYQTANSAVPHCSNTEHARLACQRFFFSLFQHRYLFLLSFFPLETPFLDVVI